MQFPTIRQQDRATTADFGRITDARFIDLETGEILERRQMLHFGRTTADAYAGRRSVCSNCTAKRRRRSTSWSVWAANLVKQFALIAVLGLVLVVIVELGR